MFTPINNHHFGKLEKSFIKYKHENKEAYSNTALVYNALKITCSSKKKNCCPCSIILLRS